MDNEFDPKLNDSQDKHQQAQSNLEDLQRVLAKIQTDEPAKAEPREIRRVELPPQEAVESQEKPAVNESESEADEPKKKKEIIVEKKELPPQQPETAADTGEPEIADIPEETAPAAEPEEQSAGEQLEPEPVPQCDVQVQAHQEPVQHEAIRPQPTATAVKEKDSQTAAVDRKNRMMRIGTAVVILLVAIVVVVSAVRGLNGKDSQPADSDVKEPSQSTVSEEPALPASQQESEQYKKIKDDDSLPSYALGYPGMYADAVGEPNKESETKVCYLTFDDGPSSTNTPHILDILKEADVKATFFVVADEIDGCEDILQRIVDEGHTLCIHCNNHEYGHLYQSIDGYLEDFAAAYDKIYELTGYRVQGFRFPGGSNNVIMERHDTYDTIVSEMTRRGFEYYDWNAYDHDAENGDYTVEQIINYAVSEVKGSSRNDTILLMHDTYGKEKTVQALPTIISKLKDAGIEMKPITADTRPVHFEVSENTPTELPAVTEASDSSEN